MHCSIDQHSFNDLRFIFLDAHVKVESGRTQQTLTDCLASKLKTNCEQFVSISVISDVSLFTFWRSDIQHTEMFSSGCKLSSSLAASLPLNKFYLKSNPPVLTRREWGGRKKAVVSGSTLHYVIGHKYLTVGIICKYFIKLFMSCPPVPHGPLLVSFTNDNISMLKKRKRNSILIWKEL